MNLEEIKEQIKKKAGLSEDAINKKILEKQRELSNLVSKEGAAYIIAKELGLDILPKVKRRLEVRNIVPGIRSLNLSVRVVNIFEPKEFETKGRKGKVASVILGDSSGTIRMSLWDDQTEIVEKLEPGMAVEIFGAYTREDGIGRAEVRLSKKGGVKILKDSDIPPVEDIERSYKTEKRKTISDLKEGEFTELRAALVQLFETNIFFDICPECGRGVKEEKDGFKCGEHGKVKPKKAIVLSGVIDDGTGNIRSVFFRDNALRLINMSMEDILSKGDSIFDEVDILGKEFLISGRVRRNKMFGRLEFVANDVKEVNVIDEANKIINNLASNVK